MSSIDHFFAPWHPWPSFYPNQRLLSHSFFCLLGHLTVSSPRASEQPILTHLVFWCNKRINRKPHPPVNPRNHSLLPELPTTLLPRVPVHQVAPKTSAPCLWGRPRKPKWPQICPPWWGFLGKSFIQNSTRHQKTSQDYDWISLPRLRLERICFNFLLPCPILMCPKSLRVSQMFWHHVTRFTRRWPKISKPFRNCRHPWV